MSDTFSLEDDRTKAEIAMVKARIRTEEAKQWLIASILVAVFAATFIACVAFIRM